jgi:hypothetical protein
MLYQDLRNVFPDLWPCARMRLNCSRKLALLVPVQKVLVSSLDPETSYLIYFLFPPVLKGKC